MKNTDKRFTIPNHIRANVIQYFKNHKDNKSSTIANHYNINIKTVNLILDRFLNKKIKPLNQNKNGKVRISQNSSTKAVTTK